MGDLKLVERPQNYTLAAGQTKVVRANIKVSASLITWESCQCGKDLPLLNMLKVVDVVKT